MLVRIRFLQLTDQSLLRLIAIFIVDMLVQLADQIARYDADAYRQAVDTFLKARVCVDDGHASERIVDLMQEVSARNAEIYLTRTQQE